MEFAVSRKVEEARMYAVVIVAVAENIFSKDKSVQLVLIGELVQLVQTSKCWKYDMGSCQPRF